MNFNFNAKQVFLTYPHCPLSPEEVLRVLQEKNPIKKYTCASEAHEDGTPHVHAVISYVSRVHTKDCRYFDIQAFHPNIQTLKTVSDFSRSTDYVKKDGDFITNVAEKCTREELADSLIREGLTRDFVRKNPVLIFQNLSNIRAWLSFLETPPERAISTRKKRHVWLYGPSNSFKSSWLWAFLPLYTSAQIPQNNDWSMVRSNTDLVYADEYRGHLTVQELNRLCDGKTWLNTKGGSVFISYVVVVIVSNYSIRSCYQNVSDDIYETLVNRFNEYCSHPYLPRMPKYDL